MAMQPPPLANSLYLAMLQQERQDRERDHLRFIQDDERRNKSMMAVAQYSLQKQLQDQTHQRELEKLELQRQNQRASEAFKAMNAMERTKVTSDAALERSMLGDQAAGARTLAKGQFDLEEQRRRQVFDRGEEDRETVAAAEKEKVRKSEFNQQQDIRKGNLDATKRRVTAYEEYVAGDKKLASELANLNKKFLTAHAVTKERKQTYDAALKALNKNIMTKEDLNLKQQVIDTEKAYREAAKVSDTLAALISQGDEIAQTRNPAGAPPPVQEAAAPGRTATFQDYLNSQQ
tara:strand:- start:1523 stop:2392 length:870 start_codon:yes stop_codon:yes gene_type:complete